MPFCIVQRAQFPRSLQENDSDRVRERLGEESDGGGGWWVEGPW